MASEIRSYLENKNFSVLDWARDFRPAGATILEEIEKPRIAVDAEFSCSRKMMSLRKTRAKASFMAVPRDNVLLKAGYFTQALDKDRVAIVREEDAKMPADLGGIIYLSLKNRNQLADRKENLVTFLAQAV